jgi:hypothetical protein
MIETQNRGQEVVSSTYWQSEYANDGKDFVSCNAGALRVLLPPARTHAVTDMRGAREVVLSRGPMPDAGGREMVELMWDDGSDTPFCLHLAPQLFDELPAEPPPDSEWVCIVYTERNGAPHQEIMQVCHWRRVAALPCLKPWQR